MVGFIDTTYPVTAPYIFVAPPAIFLYDTFSFAGPPPLFYYKLNYI